MKTIIAIAVVMIVLFNAFQYISREGSKTACTVEQFQNFDAEVKANTNAEYKNSQLKIAQVVFGMNRIKVSQYTKCLDSVEIKGKEKMLCRNLQEEIINGVAGTR